MEKFKFGAEDRKPEVELVEGSGLPEQIKLLQEELGRLVERTVVQQGAADRFNVEIAKLEKNPDEAERIKSIRILLDEYRAMIHHMEDVEAAKDRLRRDAA